MPQLLGAQQTSKQIQALASQSWRASEMADNTPGYSFMSLDQERPDKKATLEQRHERGEVAGQVP